MAAPSDARSALMLLRFGFGERTSRVFNMLALLFACIGIAQLFIWLDYRAPVKVTSRDMLTSTVRPGGEFRYRNHFVRSKFCETHVRRWFVGSDDVIREIDPLPSAMPTEGLRLPQVSEARIRVPRDMPPGPAKSCFQSRWQCGEHNVIQAIWPIIGEETCLPFIVTPAASPLSIWLEDLLIAREASLPTPSAPD